MRVLRLLSITAVFTIAAAVGAWWYVNAGASRGDRSLTFYGNVDIREVQLAFEVTGRVAKLIVVEGERVRSGQVLAQLQPERYQHAVEQNRGQLTVAEQTLAKLEAGTRSEEIARARAEVSAARAEAKNAWGRYRRLQDMESKNAVSPQDVDDGKSAAQAAQARLVAARKTLALALAGPRQEDIARARGELQMAQAELSLAQRNLADTTLRAPAAGVVRSRILEPGDMAAPEIPVYTIALNQPLWVRTYVSETELGNLRPGMAAAIHTDTHPEQPYQGWVGYISPTAEFTPKSVESPEVRTDLVYQARIYVCDARGELRLGMPVTVTIPRQQTATGPKAACRRQKQ
ncbi:efflux RND transporter periplasmic adaptor subunit [Nitrococcus mobilis]|uniref:efflux RND transporter periplasmic adaptor subunit n=1 Tax=Nitrococcus mobilis TaxID=35797 RepID=UPI0002F4298A|nr:efflux RND transporter periplasmic adaptor subunit [Nitrococcus mobilis]